MNYKKLKRYTKDAVRIEPFIDSESVKILHSYT